MSQTSTPEARTLPEDYYGGFDVKPTPDGGKRYRLPHTLFGTVMPMITDANRLGMVLIATLFLTIVLGAPADPFWFGACLTYLALHAGMAIVATLWAAITGYRRPSFITIRADGLVWNDAHFFPASHIWMVGYGITSREGKPDESFAPLITLQVGTKSVVLVEHLDEEAGKMFHHLFPNDTRRFWHGHN